jgi:competence protein ComEC
MYMLGAAALLAGLPRQPVVVLSLSLCIQTLYDPSSALGPSFILSYAALAGILLLSDPFHVFLEGRLPRVLAQPLAASLGAFTASAPAVIAFFGILRPVGIVSGLVVVPLISLFIFLSVLYLILGGIGGPLAGILDVLLTYIQELTQRIVSAASLVPGIPASLPLILLLCFSASAALVLLGQRRRRYRSYLAPFA